MTERFIAPGEAWEAVERLKITVDWNRLLSEWCASTQDLRGKRADIGWGTTPLEAVAHLLERIGETATTQVEVANV